MFDARILVQAKLDHCDAMRRANNGDELALARTHHDANGSLPRLVAFIRTWLSTAGQASQARRSRLA